MQRFAPAEIELEFADSTYLFRIPAKQIAQLQELRGYRVSWPDGASGHRPKALGTIFREHTTGDYDPADSREIVRQGLLGGGKVDQTQARILLEDHFDPWPQEEKWKFATAVLMACCQGFQPTGDEPPKKPKGRSRRTSSSTSPPPPQT